ncbi:Tar ligand binding domain homologue [Georgfuchsia toluolica]|uniref:Tar ligand binding domain homologue n=1 Tax=Georgfuchsia toluolica TaxID=424218 RepID=A0A916J114_9PROT|nr:methyl-accepting chemotaxis protein [Georgfuchsia toluolica]CAG4882145.1 Tar ligand binding domain homologue [Georgfuchsia toluolica]
MENLTIKLKLILLAALSLVSLAIVGTSGLFGVRQLIGALDEIQNRSMPAVASMSELRSNKLQSLQATYEIANINTEVFEASKDSNVNNTALKEDISLAKSVLERVDITDKQAKAAVDLYMKLPKTPREQAQWKVVSTALKEFDTQYLSLLEQIKQLANVSSPEDVRSIMVTYGLASDGVTASVPQLLRDLDKLQAITKQNSDEVKTSAARIETGAETLIGVMLAVAVIGLGAMTALIVRNVVGSLRAMQSAMARVAQTYDFTTRMGFKGKDEITQTANAFDSLLDSVQSSLRAVLESAGSINNASDSAADAAKRGSEASERQSEAASDMAAAIEEMTANISQISDGAREVLSRSKDASNRASQGTKIITQTAGEMDTINRTVGLAGETINNVGDQSNKISTIMHVIREVAEQTNLLALNAAIEAARAGEQGRGFAVVADEVRKLAERTARSTEEIGSMIAEMQSSSREAVDSIESIVHKVKEGKDLSIQAANHMSTIQENTEHVTLAIDDISSALNEQSASTQEIAHRVELVAQLSEENCRVANDTTKFANQIKNYAESLRSAANRFKV